MLPAKFLQKAATALLNVDAINVKFENAPMAALKSLSSVVDLRQHIDRLDAINVDFEKAIETASKILHNNKCGRVEDEIPKATEKLADQQQFVKQFRKAITTVNLEQFKDFTDFEQCDLPEVGLRGVAAFSLMNEAIVFLCVVVYDSKYDVNKIAYAIKSLRNPVEGEGCRARFRSGPSGDHDRKGVCTAISEVRR